MRVFSADICHNLINRHAMSTFASRIIDFNRHLSFNGVLPEGIRIMNPFKEEERAMETSTAFYRKFYNDNQKRHLILGINPGRFGGAVTGVPFTDTKRLKDECGIPYAGRETHEPSSVFIYDMIAAFGGVEAFYRKFYINSICPLGFTNRKSNGREVNYNYYDNADLQQAVSGFILSTLRQQLALGVYTETCFCLGTGKNETFLRKLNEEHGFFGQIFALEHPRFIVQYKAALRHQYINKYVWAFRSAGNP